MGSSVDATRPYALLSLAAAVATIGLKFSAYKLTGSIGLLSEAAESVINLITAGVALWALTLASQPPDKEHPFGHSKAEYFSSGLEGACILVAAVGIVWVAIPRFLHPQPVEQIGYGLLLSVLSAVINGGVAFLLLNAGKRLRSLALSADGHHLMTDVWTSGGVILGLILVHFTGLTFLDPLIALLIAVNIVWTGLRLMRETADGLLDSALPEVELAIITEILANYQKEGIQFHALRTRAAASHRFVSFHILVPGAWSIQKGHDLCEEIELAITAALPMTDVDTHLEPAEDPISWTDAELRSHGKSLM
jgi:cation diffusion facilitator family transporter